MGAVQARLSTYVPLARDDRPKLEKIFSKEKQPELGERYCQRVRICEVASKGLAPVSTARMPRAFGSW